MNPRFHNTSFSPKFYSSKNTRTCLSTKPKLKNKFEKNKQAKKVTSGSAKSNNEVSPSILLLAMSQAVTALILGISKLLSMPKPKKSIREAFYLRSNYIAEYHCTISNIGFFLEYLYSRKPNALIAGTCSAISHAYPSLLTQMLDFAGIFYGVYDAYPDRQVLYKDPATIATLILAGVMFALDSSTRNLAEPPQEPIYHDKWHYAAATAMHFFNAARDSKQSPILSAAASLSASVKSKI